MSKYHGISYPAVNGWLPEFVYKLWERFMCPHGYHLLDEVWSPDLHHLVCDACELEIYIDAIVDSPA